ncbi:MAG: Histidine kinaselike ATPase domain [Gaiellales bacterium]|nr:Histidine kinaselike ATPase domain [Gaiellales bacterium]
MAAFAEEHCSGDQQQAFDVALAATEAGSNVIRHAYNPAGEGMIEVEAWIDGDELVVEVSDHGVGMPADAFEAKGLGLKIIRAISYLTVLENAGGGTRLRMTFPLPQSA